MTEISLHRLDIVTVLQRDRSKRVAQRMKGAVSKATRAQNPLEMFIYRATIEWFAKVVGKDQIPLIIPHRLCDELHLVLALLLFPQYLHRNSLQVQRSALFPLWAAQGNS